MKKNTILFYLTLLMTLVLTMGCQTKKSSEGADDDLIVMADSTHWDLWKEPVRKYFAAEKPMPIMESEFFVKQVPGEKFNSYKTRKNILLIGILDGKDITSKIVTKMLSEEVKEKVRNGEYFYFIKNDVWAYNQTVIVAVGMNPDDVFTRFYAFGKQMIRNFRSYYYGQLQKRMFSVGEQKKVEKSIMENHDFAIRVQHDYELLVDNPKTKFLWLRRAYPDRSLFIHWEEKASPEWVEFDKLVQIRNKLAAKYYEKDSVDFNFTKSFRVTFNGKKALKIEGVWKNSNYFIGGPFRMYAFYDSLSQRLYMIDFYVHEPTTRKKPYLDQLEIIANSFRLKREIEDLKNPWNE